MLIGKPGVETRRRLEVVKMCCGNPDAAAPILSAKGAWTIGGNNLMASNNNAGVLLEFKGLGQGTAMYKGKATDKEYYAGALPPHNFIEVDADDVEGFLNLREGRSHLFVKADTKDATKEFENIRTDNLSDDEIRAQVDKLNAEIDQRNKARAQVYAVGAQVDPNFDPTGERKATDAAELAPEEKAKQPGNDMTVREATADEVKEIESKNKPGRPAK